ncbi:MAG: metal-dependent transcriptional regulator [Christensenellales bacterium]|jgi:DtxR family Mn-dependent transcriptional regulator
MINNEFHTVRGYQLLRKSNRQLTSAMEDYLEMIYRNIESEGYLRINELAKRLHVKASSATKMVQKLGEVGLITYKKYGIIVLTESGKEIGEYLLRRHTIIENFLKTIGITENYLVETELIEHNISANTLEHMDMMNKYFIKYPDMSKSIKNFITENKKNKPV